MLLSFQRSSVIVHRKTLFTNWPKTFYKLIFYFELFCNIVFSLNININYYHNLYAWIFFSVLQSWNYLSLKLQNPHTIQWVVTRLPTGAPLWGGNVDTCKKKIQDLRKQHWIINWCIAVRVFQTLWNLRCHIFVLSKFTKWRQYYYLIYILNLWALYIATCCYNTANLLVII